MAFIADVFLAAGAMAAAFYCFVLSRRLKRFTDLEHGVGGAIAVLSVQVDDLAKALQRAEVASRDSARGLAAQTESATEVAKRLELLVASMHDLPEPSAPEQPIDPFFVRQPAAKEGAV